ncbi:MAG: YkvA family protein [Dokdonella sp.]|uniref:YkvA family protein n=1 Tax=Dokdonella sp. TaxID=2291710 RepID=UPI00326332B3
MSLAITIELGDADLQHFIDAMQRAQKEAAHLSPREITDAASKLLVEGHQITLPNFIAQRLGKLDSMIAMVNDEGFALPEEDRNRVLACLTYFANPEDIIPDSVPVLGFLDDAIMIELCVRELQHEIEAYEDFVVYRRDEAAAHGVDPSTLKTQRVEWAEARRVELIERMRKRRGQSYQTSSGWRPTLFSFRS